MKNSKMTKSKPFKLSLLVVATVLFLLSIFFPDSNIPSALLELLLGAVLGTFAIDRLKEKRWLAFSVYVLVSFLSVLTAVRMILISFSH